MATPATPTTAATAPAQNAVPKRAVRSLPDDDDDDEPRCFFGFSAISPVMGAASSSRSACAEPPFSVAAASPPFDATTCGAADSSMRTMFGFDGEPNDLTTLPLSSLPST